MSFGASGQVMIGNRQWVSSNQCGESKSQARRMREEPAFWRTCRFLTDKSVRKQWPVTVLTKLTHYRSLRLPRV